MSSLLSKIESLFSSGEHYLVTLGKKELKVAATSSLGVAIKAAITAGEAGTTTVQKIELGIASLAPVIKTYITDPAALESDIETTARLVLEDVLAQIKTTGPLAIIETLAKMF